MDVDTAGWSRLRAEWRRGRHVSGTVVRHMPFGIFLDLGVQGALGLIRITDFCLPPKRMTPAEYPAIGSKLEARVLGFDDRNRQVQLTLIPESPFLIDPMTLDADRLLALWSWLLPDGCRLLAAAKLGDLFLMTVPENRVLWLDLLEGRVTDVAESPTDFQVKSLDPRFADDWFLPGFAEGAEARGLSLAPGECFAFEIHPKLGGDLSSANLRTMNLLAYHAVCAGLHKLRPGTALERFTVDGEVP